MSKKAIVVLVVILISCLLLSLCCVGSLALLSTASGDLFSGVNKQSLMSGDYSQTVAVIDLDGVITSTSESDLFGNTTDDITSRTINKLDAVINDDSVKAVLLRVNSPGGEVYATRLIYNKIMDVKEAGKKVVVLMEDTAASGGYYIAAAGDKIVASEMTLTGSIGVIFSTVDLTGLYEKLGVKEIQVSNTEGKLKVLDDLSNENSEGYKLLQGLADDYYDNFVNAVAAGRGKTVAEIKAVADGRVYSGRQAKENGLVDELGEFNEADEVLRELAGLSNPNYVLYADEINSFSAYGLKLVNLLNPAASLLGDYKPKLGVYAYYLLDY